MLRSGRSSTIGLLQRIVSKLHMATEMLEAHVATYFKEEIRQEAIVIDTLVAVLRGVARPYQCLLYLSARHVRPQAFLND
jgi:hypothetical protein